MAKRTANRRTRRPQQLDALTETVRILDRVVRNLGNVQQQFQLVNLRLDALERERKARYHMPPRRKR